MEDDFAVAVANLVERGPLKISGVTEIALAGAAVLIGAGVFKFLSNSSVKAEGPIPPVNVGNLNVGERK